MNAVTAFLLPLGIGLSFVVGWVTYLLLSRWLEERRMPPPRQPFAPPGQLFINDKPVGEVTNVEIKAEWRPRDPDCDCGAVRGDIPRPTHVNCRCIIGEPEPTPPETITLVITCALCKTTHDIPVPGVMTLAEKRTLLFQNALCKKCKN